MSQQFGDINALLVQLRSLLLNGDYVLGREVSGFEAAFAAYCQCEYEGVNTGTDALIIAMRALGIGAGDEVIVPANTFHATVAAIELAGATPVLVDAKPDSYLLDERQVPGLLSQRTKAIIPVHLFGKPVPMSNILELAARHNLLVIEDAAQAHGARYQGKPVGSFGVTGCFSFHPSKNLAAAGDAGAIVTQNAELADKIDLYRALGQRQQNEHVVVGLNSKMDALQAKVLSWKLHYLDEWICSRAQIAAWYRSELQDLPLSFQAYDSDETHVYHLFQIQTPRRDELLRFLKARGIDAVVRYPTPIHLQPAFQKWGWKQASSLSRSAYRKNYCVCLSGPPWTKPKSISSSRACVTSSPPRLEARQNEKLRVPGTLTLQKNTWRSRWNWVYPVSAGFTGERLSFRY
jgi:dTDP-4-amino-4,6-dideoxygalactose transaminase